MAGVITPDLNDFIRQLDIYHTRKTTLATKLAHVLIKHQHKRWQERNELVPHTRKPRRPHVHHHKLSQTTQPSSPAPSKAPCTHGQAVACHCHHVPPINPRAPVSQEPELKCRATRPRTLNQKHHAFHMNRHEELHRRNMWDPNSPITFDTPVPPLPYKVQDLPNTQKRKATRPKDKPKMTSEEKTKARATFFTKQTKAAQKLSPPASTTPSSNIQTPPAATTAVAAAVVGSRTTTREQQHGDHRHHHQQQHHVLLMPPPPPPAAAGAAGSQKPPTTNMEPLLY